MSRKNPHPRLKLLIVLLMVTALGLSGCGAGEESTTEQGQTGAPNPGTPGGSTDPGANPGSDSDPNPGSDPIPNPGDQPSEPAVACDSLQTQFNTEIWPILQTQCFGCHEQNKVTSDLVLLGDSFNNYLQTNFTTFRQVAAKKDNS